MTAALLKQTRTIPIVFALVSDPVGEHFVESLARPGGNVTGFTNVESSLTGKWLELLKEVAPSTKRAGFIFDPKLAPGGGSYYTRLIKASAPSFAVARTAMPVHEAAEIERAIGEFAREPNGGLLVLPDATTWTHRALIIALAARYICRQFMRSATSPSMAACCPMVLISSSSSGKRRLRRSHPQRRKAGGAASAVADEIRADHQSQDGEGARPRHTVPTPATRRRVDRITRQCPLLAQSRHCLVDCTCLLLTQS